MPLPVGFVGYGEKISNELSRGFSPKQVDLSEMSMNGTVSLGPGHKKGRESIQNRTVCSSVLRQLQGFLYAVVGWPNGHHGEAADRAGGQAAEWQALSQGAALPSRWRRFSPSSPKHRWSR